MIFVHWVLGECSYDVAKETIIEHILLLNSAPVQELEKVRNAIPPLETIGDTVSLYGEIESSYNQW